MDIFRNLIENFISIRDDVDYFDEYDFDRKYFVEEICDEVYFSFSFFYITF